jgi:hypothetical protein
MAALSGEKTLAELSVEFGVHPAMIRRWGFEAPVPPPLVHEALSRSAHARRLRNRRRRSMIWVMAIVA